MSGQHRKQHYGKTWVCYSGHFRTWLSRNHPLIFTLAHIGTVGTGNCIYAHIIIHNIINNAVTWPSLC